jgi:CRISPR-associated endoribonuclease Cas6
MRLKLLLSANNSGKIALNYNYSLSSAIYKLLHFGSPEFSQFLHNIGYNSNDKIYKLFTFSLKFESTRLVSDYLQLNSPLAYLYISSPLIDDFIKNFLVGSFEGKSFELYAEFIKTEFTIKEIELIPEPEFNDRNKFSLMSPLVLSTHAPYNNKNSQYYLRISDDIKIINQIFNNNLINKYSIVTGKDYTGPGVELNWDDEYISEANKKNKRLSKKVSIIKDYDSPIHIVGIFCPFYLTGDIELMKIGYESGFGEKNSMGFGMTFKD